MGPNESGECQWELKRTIIEVEKKINQNEYKSLKIHRVKYAWDFRCVQEPVKFQVGRDVDRFLVFKESAQQAGKT